MPDQWEQAAKNFKPAAGDASAPAANEDWKLWQTGGQDTPAEPSLLQKAMTGAKDLVTGAGKGLLHTVSGTDDWARQHLPAVMTNSNMGFGAPADLEHVKQMATPEGMAQKIGYGGEQVGEFLLPGGAEEKGAAKLAKLAPKLGKFAKPLAKVLTSGLSSGAVNTMQGGSPVTGALMGAGGQVIGQGLKAMAPTVAESALGIPKVARAFGKTPGRAIIDETRGIRPETIAASAQDRMGQLTPQLEQAAAASTAPASLLPARQVVSDSINRATGQNAESLVNQLRPQQDFLTRRFDTGAAIPDQIMPSDLLNLKRGFSKEFMGRWNPEIHADTTSTGRNAYHALDSELDRTVPEAPDLDQRISSLIPVAQRAESVSRNAPTLQRALGRFGAHTGALAGAGIGGSLGYHEGGVPGAIAGGLTGVLAPELIASPEGQMGIARTLNKANGLKPLVGTLLQADRKKKE